MTHPSPYTDSDGDGDTTRRPGRSPTATYPGTPRWVKVSAIVVIALVLLGAVIMAAGVGGQHGPGRHNVPSGDAGGRTTSIAQGVRRT